MGNAKKCWLSRFSISRCKYSRVSCKALLCGLGDTARVLSLKFLSDGTKSNAVMPTEPSKIN